MDELVKLGNVTMLSSTDFGSAPDWLAAIGTVGTLGFLVAQNSRERRQRLVEEKLASQDARFREAAQARLMSTRLQWQWTEEGGHEAVIDVVNHSAAPFFDVIATLHDHDVPWENDGRPLGGTFSMADLLEPHEKRTFVVAAPLQRPRRTRGDGTGAAAYQLTFDARLEYTDVTGLRWARLGNGLLERLQPA